MNYKEYIKKSYINLIISILFLLFTLFILLTTSKDNYFIGVLMVICCALHLNGCISSIKMIMFFKKKLVESKDEL